MRVCDSYATAMQTIALFGLKLNRFPAMIGASLFFIMYIYHVCLVRAITQERTNPDHALVYYQSGLHGLEVRWLLFRTFF
jgi:hypothetical protein